MTDETLYQISQLLERAKNPALWLSFGKDSLLLLRLALRAGFGGSCYYFGDDKLSQLAQQTIIDHSLTVYSWPATNRYVVPSGEKWVQVDEFLVDNVLVPFLSPIIEGEQCEHMRFERRFTRSFKYPHDITFTGYKSSDYSEVVGKTFPRELEIGVTRLVNPLYDWSNEQVIEALGFTPPDTNSVEYCNECLAIIDQMDRDAALARFRSRYNFN